MHYEVPLRSLSLSAAAELTVSWTLYPQAPENLPHPPPSTPSSPNTQTACFPGLKFVLLLWQAGGRSLSSLTAAPTSHPFSRPPGLFSPALGDSNAGPSQHSSFPCCLVCGLTLVGMPPGRLHPDFPPEISGTLCLPASSTSHSHLEQRNPVIHLL